MAGKILQSKKSVSKRFWWVIPVVIILVTVLSVFIFKAIEENIKGREMKVPIDKAESDKNNIETTKT